MTRPKTSPIWITHSDIEFLELVKNSEHISEILSSYGLKNKGGNYRTVNQRIKELNIDSSHMKTGCGSNTKYRSNIKKIKLTEILVVNSSFNRTHLKERLIKEKIFINVCSECGNNGTWQNKILSLHLEHKNGISNDNRLENLCLLCPNCHSQTDTYAGKKNRIVEKKDTQNIKPVKNLCVCGSEKVIRSKTCSRCAKLSMRKVDRPEKLVLLEEIETYGYSGTARRYGVSDNAIRKWIKSY